MIENESKIRAQLALLSEPEKDDLIIRLMNEVTRLTARVAELEARLGMKSTNSSKPPSSDGRKKPQPKSLRRKSGRKPGGQKGRKGTTLRQVPNPDEVRDYTPERRRCGQARPGRTVHQQSG